VNGILIIYDQNKTNIEQTLKEFNNLKLSIKFTIGKELREEINFLFLTIHRKDKKLKFSIYKKPRPTNIIIPIEFSLLHIIQTSSGVHPTSYPMDTGSSFPRGKASRA
jgi:hypothetical protein